MKIDTVGIAILDHLPLGVDHVTEPGQHCTFFGRAREGHAMWAAGDDITCPLARFNLGIDPPNEETIAHLAETIVSWGAAKDGVTARRFIAGLLPLPFGRRIFVYAPLETMPFPPNLVVRVLSAAEGMREIHSVTALTGRRTEGQMAGVGGLCGECTAFLLHCEHTAVSLGCSGSRREAALDEGELFFAVPYFLYRQLDNP
jgi:uncharacterized protein (DUF169 family)